MSFDATRAAWSARRAGGLDGGPALLVALALADLTYQDTGEAVTGTRGLAAVCGIGKSTVTDALRELEGAGVIERAERGQGSRPSRWRWRLAAPCTPSAPPGDNPGPRTPAGTLETGPRYANGKSRTPAGTLAYPTGNNYQDQVYPRVNPNFENDLPAHLRDTTEPTEISHRVAALRDALSGPRGGRRSPPLSHFGGDAAPPCDPTELLQRPDIGAEYGDPEDGWQP